MRVLGKRTAKRRNKKNRFDHRRDKTKTARRKALSSFKSDKIDSDHNPDASNDADDEAEDVEMEGEDADGKV